MKKILGAVTVLLAAVLLSCGLPGSNPKPVPTYTPAPAWSWPYGNDALAPVSFTWPKPTVTPPGKRRIEVVDQLRPSKWRVSQAAEWLDKYTASNMVTVSRCSGRAWKCIYVRGGKLPGNILALTQGNRITVDYGKVDRHGYRSNLKREEILAHELFHTFAPGYGHSRSGYNLMRATMSKSRLYVTPGQRRILAKL